MSKKNLPVKSQSRKIQKQHLRRYKKGNVTLVNQGVEKEESRVAPIRKVQVRDITRSKGKAITKTIPFNKRGLVDKRKFVVSTPANWRNVFSLVKGPTALELEAKKEKEEKALNLRPGERYAREIKNVKITKKYGSEVPFLDIEIINEKGEYETIIAKLDAGSSVTNRFLQYLINLKGKKKPIVFKEPVKRAVSPNEFMKATLDPDFVPTNFFDFRKEGQKNLKSVFGDDADIEVIEGPGGFRAILSGTRDIEYVRDPSTGVVFKAKVPARKYLYKTNPDGSFSVLGLNKNDEPISVRTFENADVAQKALVISAQTDSDVMGVPWDEQKNLKPFALDLAFDGNLIYSMIVPNNNFIKQAFFVDTGKTVRVLLTNFFDELIKEFSRDFPYKNNTAGEILKSTDKAINYAFRVGESYNPLSDEKIEKQQELKEDSGFHYEAFTNNSNLKKFTIDRISNVFIVRFTDSADYFVDELSKGFRTLAEAKKYAKRVERNYRG